MSEILTAEPSSFHSSDLNKTKKQKSNVWDHFQISDSNPKKAVCNYCPKHKNQYAYSNGGTKNLWNHLESQHKSKLK